MAPIPIPDDLAGALFEAAKYHEAVETGAYYGTFTAEEHLERFRTIDAEYRASSCAALIEEIIRSKKPATGWPIDNAIAFGFCSFSSAYWGKRSDSFFWQLSSFLHIIELVEEGAAKPLVKYAQDPLFNSIDKEFVEKLGIKVTEDPEGLSLIKKSTFLYCPFLPRNIPVLQQDEQPVLYMGNETTGTIWWLAGELHVTDRTRTTNFRKLIPEARDQLPGRTVGSKENFEKLKKTLVLTTDDGPEAPLQQWNKAKAEYKKHQKGLDALIKFRKTRQWFKAGRCGDVKEGTKTHCKHDVCLNIAIDRSLGESPDKSSAGKESEESESSYPWIEWPLGVFGDA